MTPFTRKQTQEARTRFGITHAECVRLFEALRVYREGGKRDTMTCSPIVKSVLKTDVPYYWCNSGGILVNNVYSLETAIRVPIP